MALSQRLDLRQSQSLVMTPQLQQAIKLLQLSNIELTEFVDREIEQNPLLEREGGDGGDTGDSGAGNGLDANGAGPDTGDGLDRGADPDGPDPWSGDTHELTGSDRLATGSQAPLDTDYENVWTHASAAENGADAAGALSSWGNRGGSTGFDDEGPDLEQTLSSLPSLREHLASQINVDLADPVDRMIGLTLIDALDDAGYLTADVAALAGQLGCPTARVEAGLAAAQRLDPPGIFARSLAECLALQLRERNRLDPAMQALLDHLDLLAQRNVAALIRLCGVDAEDISDMVAEIKTLDPKPALAFDHTPTHTIAPDVLMRAQPQGGWVIELNPETLPRVLINQRYYTTLSGALRSKSDRDYLSERLTAASWLVRSLHQRANTILKVATEIVRQQDAFFLHGVRYLKPLILRDIAEAIGMHESTVSRVTTNKFMSTPRGLFELKYFFTSAIPGADGRAAHSAEAVRFRIKALVDQERADAILSDDQIVEILRRDGIDIARRTVAKYREALRIPSSVQRRRDKAMRL